MQSHSTTVFPLFETVMISANTANGFTVTPDAAANTGGATLTSNATGKLSDDVFRLTVPGHSYDVTMTSGGFYCYGLVCGDSSGTDIELWATSPYTVNLTYMWFGGWGAFGNNGYSFANFVTGYRTPDSSIPTTGTANFAGSVVGSTWAPQGSCVVCLSGKAAMQANFGTGKITGNLTNMMYQQTTPWNDVSLSGTISTGINAFSGTTAVTSAPAGQNSLGSSATGTFGGMFFGPSAQELGAVWTLYDGTKAATGSIGAKNGP